VGARILVKEGRVMELQNKGPRKKVFSEPLVIGLAQIFLMPSGGHEV